jgi:hypothetical protein
VSGLKYVGSDYVSDNNSNDLLTKLDVDTAFANAAVSQTVVASAVTTAVGNMASQTSVNNALSAFIQPGYVTNVEATLIPLTEVGALGGIAPLNSSGVIPSQFVPSLGSGYCLGPFGPTAVTSVTAGAQPVKFADWSIGVQNISFQPLVFMSVLAGAVNGGRPVIEVRISSGVATYANQTLVARGVGRSCWNDAQTINVLPAPASAGHTGVAGTGYPTTYNTWLSAWLYDANAQQVSISTGNVANAGAYLIRNQA